VIRFALYARVSTEDQHAEKQVEALQEYCMRNNHEIYDIYVDVYSGIASSRPQFNRLLEDMRHYRFQGIMVTKLDRIGRSLAHMLSLFDEFKRKSVHFVATTQNIDTTTAMGTFFFQIMGAWAEYERNLISERTKEGLRLARNVGKRGKDKKPRKKRGVLRNAVYL